MRSGVDPDSAPRRRIRPVRSALLAPLLLAAALSAQRGTVQGRVVDPQGEPLGGATVTGGAAEAVADAGGRFALTVTDLASARLELRRSGYATAQVDVAGRTALGAIGLPPGAPLAGRVVDEAGEPLAGIEVAAVDQVAELPLLGGAVDRRVRYLATTRTGADGRFVIPDGLAAGARVVARLGAGIESGSGPVGAGVPVELVAPRVRNVTGRVVDAGGDGVGGALVTVVAGGRRVTWVEADVAGRFEIAAPEGAAHEVHAVVLRAAARVAATPVVLPPRGDVTAVRLEVGGVDWPVLRLQTTDELAVFTVGAVFRDAAAPREWTGPLAAMLTDRVWIARDGVLEIPFVPEGTPFLAEVRAPGKGRTRIEGRAESGSELRVELPAETVVRGRVVDAVHGAPVAGAEVAVDRASPVDATAHHAQLDAHPPIEAITDDAGRFELRELSAGRWDVFVRLGSGHPVARSQLLLRAGELVEGIEVVLDLGGTVRGTVAGGEAGWQVQAVPIDGDLPLAPVVAVLGEDGTFRLDHVARGAVRLELVVPPPPRLGAGAPIPLDTVVVGDDPVEVRFDATELVRVVRGRVRVLGAPPPLGRLVVVLEPDVAWSAPTDWLPVVLAGRATFVQPDGAFELTVPVGEQVPMVLDAATGVVLERLEARVVAAAPRPFELGELTVRSVLASVRITGPEPVLRSAERVEVDVGPLFPRASNRRMLGLPVDQPVDSGIGIQLARGQRRLELFLPPSGAELRLRGAHRGRPRQNVLASVEVDPRDTDRVTVELRVEER